MNKFFHQKAIHKYICLQATKKRKSITDYCIQQQNTKLKISDMRENETLERGKKAERINI